ncbi:MAG: GNAT family N-acetyltransferase [Bacteroidota bacterium]
MNNVSIRNASLDDAKDFAELMLISAPYFPLLFGENIRMILQHLFSQHRNLFSFEHVYFAEIHEKIAGMIIGYDSKTKRQESLLTGALLFAEMKDNFLKKLPLLAKFNKTVGQLSKNDFYISNVATYFPYRGKGIGTKLMFEIEKVAKEKRTKRILLDVEKENREAIRFYAKLGYQVSWDFSIQLTEDTILSFHRMSKEL